LNKLKSSGLGGSTAITSAAQRYLGSRKSPNMMKEGDYLNKSLGGTSNS